MSSVWVTLLALSCLAMFTLPLWSVLLLRHSRSFEIPDRAKTKAGASCLIASVLYLTLGLTCFYKLFKDTVDQYRGVIPENAAALLRKGPRWLNRASSAPHEKASTRKSLNRQVEMKPLLKRDSFSENGVGSNDTGISLIDPQSPLDSARSSDRFIISHDKSEVRGREIAAAAAAVSAMTQRSPRSEASEERSRSGAADPRRRKKRRPRQNSYEPLPSSPSRTTSSADTDDRSLPLSLQLPTVESTHLVRYRDDGLPFSEDDFFSLRQTANNPGRWGDAKPTSRRGR